jgi:hypothetical protein
MAAPVEEGVPGEAAPLVAAPAAAAEDAAAEAQAAKAARRVRACLCLLKISGLKPRIGSLEFQTDLSTTHCKL